MCDEVWTEIFFSWYCGFEQGMQHRPLVYNALGDAKNEYI